jgi:hypothetical protein
MHEALGSIHSTTKNKYNVKSDRTTKQHGTEFEVLFFFFFLVGLEFELRALQVQSRQACYCLSHISSPFCSGYFADGASRLFA